MNEKLLMELIISHRCPQSSQIFEGQLKKTTDLPEP
jgi:hypothetical protein